MSLKAVAIALNAPVPSEFICPLTGDVMNKPVMTRSGMNFERYAIIERIIEGENVILDSVTNEPLEVTGLVPNKALESKIDHWKFCNFIPDIVSSSSSKDNMDDAVVAIFSPTEKKTVRRLYRAAVASKMFEKHHKKISTTTATGATNATSHTTRMNNRSARMA